MGTVIESCKRVLVAVGSLHRRGYEGLRVMPMLDGQEWTLLIGPRLAFSSRDGAFVPADLRPRCMRFKPQQSLPDTDDAFELLRSLYGGADLLSPLLESPAPQTAKFTSWLEHSKLQDPEYRGWYLTIGGSLLFGTNVLPYRRDIEVPMSPDGPVFSAVFRAAENGVERASIGEPLARPPGGKAFSSGTSKVINDPVIQVAQERPKDAPNLHWSGSGDRTGGRNLDEWYDDYVHRD